MNYEVVDVNSRFNQYGLLEVSFLCRNFIEYPTALNQAYTLYDDPQIAFRNGDSTSKLLPEFTYQSMRYQQNQKYYKCTSICLQDGSKYIPFDSERILTNKDKFRVFAASTDLDKLGLRHVTFEGVGLIANKPIYPTSLASQKSLKEKTLDAFWGGNESIMMSAQFERHDERLGWVWKTETILKNDGSNISSGDLILSQDDYIEYQFPGRVDVTANYGIEDQPGGDRQVNIVHKFYLDKNSVSFSGTPFFISQYAKAGFYAQFEDDDNPTAHSGGFRGYLAGSAAAGNTSFMGKDCVGFSSYVSSSISYAEFISSFKSGLMLSAKAELAFIDANSDKWFLREEIFIK